MIRRRGGGEGVSRLDLRWEYWIWNGVEHANLQCAVMSKMEMMMSDSDDDEEDMMRCKINLTFQSEKPPNFKVVLEW